MVLLEVRYVYLKYKLERYAVESSHFVSWLFAQFWHLSYVKCSNHRRVYFSHSWSRKTFTRSISKHIWVHRRAFGCSHLLFSWTHNDHGIEKNKVPLGGIKQHHWCRSLPSQCLHREESTFHIAIVLKNNANTSTLRTQENLANWSKNI